MSKIAENLSSLHRILILVAVALILFAKGDGDELKFTRAQGKIDAVLRNHALVVSDIADLIGPLYGRQFADAIPKKFDSQAETAAVEKFRAAIARTRILPGFLDVTDSFFKIQPHGQSPKRTQFNWRLPLDRNELWLFHIQQFMSSAPRKMMLPKYHLHPDPLRDALGAFYRDFFVQDSNQTIEAYVYPPREDDAPDEPKCRLALRASVAGEVERAWRNYLVRCDRMETEDRSAYLFGLFNDADYLDYQIPYVKDLDRKRYPSIKQEFKILVDREATPKDRSVNILGLEIEASIARTIVPIVIVGLLLQMLALLSVARRLEITEVDADAMSWFILARHWTVIPLIASILFLPVGAILFAGPRIAEFGLWQDAVRKAPILFGCAAVTMILSIAFVRQSWLFAGRLTLKPTKP